MSGNTINTSTGRQPEITAPQGGQQDTDTSDSTGSSGSTDSDSGAYRLAKRRDGVDSTSFGGIRPRPIDSGTGPLSSGKADNDPEGGETPKADAPADEGGGKAETDGKPKDGEKTGTGDNASGNQPVVGASQNGDNKPSTGSAGKNGGQPVVGADKGGEKKTKDGDKKPVVGDGTDKPPKAGEDDKDKKPEDKKDDKKPSLMDKFSEKTKAMVDRITTGLAKVQDGKVVQGMVSMLGNLMQKLNYRQGTSMGDGTCGLCSTENQKKAREMAQALLKGGKEALSNLLGSGKMDNKKLEYSAMNNLSHVGGGGTTWDQQINNMKKEGIYGGHDRVDANRLAEIVKTRTAQINLCSGRLYGGGGNGIDHAVSIQGVREGANGQKEFALVDSSGMYAGKGMQWITEARLKSATLGDKFDCTWSKAFT